MQLHTVGEERHTGGTIGIMSVIGYEWNTAWSTPLRLRVESSISFLIFDVSFVSVVVKNEDDLDLVL